MKPGNARNEYEVAGLSGATFTAVGVDEMMNRSLEVYNKYFEKMRTNTVENTMPVIDTATSMDTVVTVMDSIAVLAIN